MRLPLRQTLVSAIVLVATHTAFAQPSKTVELEDLTWTEIRDEIHAGKTTLIIPIGSVSLRRSGKIGQPKLRRPRWP
jgi:creatinine amidohydrolase